MGPKLMNRCEPKEARNGGKMLKIILKLEGGGVPDREAEGWQIVENRSVTRKECKTLRENFEDGRFMAQNNDMEDG